MARLATAQLLVAAAVLFAACGHGGGGAGAPARGEVPVEAPPTASTLGAGDVIEVRVFHRSRCW
jgi:hypothetical protein